MKNKNIKKAVLALALTSVAFGPCLAKAHASDSTQARIEYLETYKEFENTLEKAKEAKASYKYLNATYLSMKGLDAAISDGDFLKAKAKRNELTSSDRAKILNATINLKEAMGQLNGKKASISELKELIDANADFTKSYSFLYASDVQKDAYLDSYSRAYRFYIYNTDGASLSKTKLDAYVLDLKAKKSAITDAYAPFENKQALKNEIAEAAKLRNDADKYTEKSFQTFISALRLAETSVEDKARLKTASEYKEIRETLKSARLALVKKDEVDKDKKKQIEKLEDAVARNKVAVKAVNLLFEVAPKKVAPIKGQLLKLLRESEELVKMAEKLLAELKGIKG